MKKILLASALIVYGYVANAADIDYPKLEEVSVSFDDEKEYDFDLSVLKLSNTLRNMIEDIINMGIESESEKKQLPITYVSSQLFKDTLFPLMKIAYDNRFDKKKANNLIKPALQSFEFDKTKELLIAANFLDIPKLLPLIVDHFADLLMNQDMLKELIRSNFAQLEGIPEDLLNRAAEIIFNRPQIRDYFFNYTIEAPVELPNTFDHRYIDISPDGKLLASSDNNSNGIVEIRDLETQRKIKDISTNNHTIDGIHFSPDGKFIACEFSNSIGFINLETDVFSNVQQNSYVSFLPTGKALVTSIGKIELLDPIDNTVLWTFKNRHISKYDPHYSSPDNTLVAISTTGGPIYICDVSTGALVHTFHRKMRDNFIPIKIAFLNNETLIIGSSARSIELVDPRTGVAKAIWKDSLFPLEINSIAVSQDRTMVASASYAGIVIRNDQGEIINRINPLGIIYHLKRLLFSPDGAMLVGSEGENKILKIWNPRTGLLLSTIRYGGLPYAPFTTAFTPDSSIFAVGSAYKPITISRCQKPTPNLKIPLQLILAYIISQDKELMKRKDLYPQLRIIFESALNKLSSLPASDIDEATRTNLKTLFNEKIEYITPRGSEWWRRFLKHYKKSMNPLE